MRNCIICDTSFDPNSKAKKIAGGKITHCPDCSEETETKYLGFQSGDGKQSQISILSFASPEDSVAYATFWQNNSGMHKGKSCQLGKHQSVTPNIKFKTISGVKPTNHKGRAT